MCQRLLGIVGASSDALLSRRVPWRQFVLNGVVLWLGLCGCLVRVSRLGVLCGCGAVWVSLEPELTATYTVPVPRGVC